MRQFLLWMLALSIIGVPMSSAKDKAKKNAQDPYNTAESEKAPPVNQADLAYRAVVFEDFTIPPEWEAKARKLVTETQDQAIRRLESTKAFTTVGRKQAQAPETPYLLVKGSLAEYRMVSKKARFFGGAIAGTSYITYKVQVCDGKSGEAMFQRQVSSENNAFAAAWSFNDQQLPDFLGNVLGDYLALRARTDKGASALPLDDATKK